LLHPQEKRLPALSEAELRPAIEDAISGRRGAFVYAPGLFEKLDSRNVSIQDLLHVCHTWQKLTVEWDDKYNGWRYLLDGPNLNGNWMRVILARNTTPEEIVAVTGFRYSRGRKQS
jgi:hypothetical protein